MYFHSLGPDHLDQAPPGGPSDLTSFVAWPCGPGFIVPSRRVTEQGVQLPKPSGATVALLPCQAVPDKPFVRRRWRGVYAGFKGWGLRRGFPFAFPTARAARPWDPSLPLTPMTRGNGPWWTPRSSRGERGGKRREKVWDWNKQATPALPMQVGIHGGWLMRCLNRHGSWLSSGKRGVGETCANVEALCPARSGQSITWSCCKARERSYLSRSQPHTHVLDPTDKTVGSARREGGVGIVDPYCMLSFSILFVSVSI